MKDYYLGYLEFLSHQFGEVGKSMGYLTKETIRMLGDSLHILFFGYDDFNQLLGERSFDLLLEKNVFQIIKIIEEITEMNDWELIDEEFKDFLIERFNITKQSEINYLKKTLKYLKGLDSILIRKEGIS
jgi:hypothetical protein